MLFRGHAAAFSARAGALRADEGAPRAVGRLRSIAGGRGGVVRGRGGVIGGAGSRDAEALNRGGGIFSEDGGVANESADVVNAEVHGAGDVAEAVKVRHGGVTAGVLRAGAEGDALRGAAGLVSVVGAVVSRDASAVSLLLIAVRYEVPADSTRVNLSREQRLPPWPVVGGRRRHVAALRRQTAATGREARRGYHQIGPASHKGDAAHPRFRLANVFRQAPKPHVTRGKRRGRPPYVGNGAASSGVRG